jgi:hypothetical protein
MKASVRIRENEMAACHDAAAPPDPGPWASCPLFSSGTFLFCKERMQAGRPRSRILTANGWPGRGIQANESRDYFCAAHLATTFAPGVDWPKTAAAATHALSDGKVRVVI